MRRSGAIVGVLSGLALVLMTAAPGVVAGVDAADAGHRHLTQAKPAAASRVSQKSPAAEYTPTVRFRLRTELAEGKMAFVGVGGDIEGVVNPTLRVAERRHRPGRSRQQRRDRA